MLYTCNLHCLFREVNFDEEKHMGYADTCTVKHYFKILSFVTVPDSHKYI